LHYGCEATFGSKNEWKHHVRGQHLQLGFYRCDTGFCHSDAQSSSAKSHPSAAKTYNDFNRKDLFTQHHRRMHSPWSTTSKEPSAKVKQDFENSLEDVRNRCWRERRTPPRRSTCGFCRRVFEGPDAWDERMEHVGKHFEDKHRGVTDAENLQEEEDEDLRDWAVKEGIVKDYGTRGFRLVGREPVDVQAAAERSTRRRGKGQQDFQDEEDIDTVNPQEEDKDLRDCAVQAFYPYPIPHTGLSFLDEEGIDLANLQEEEGRDLRDYAVQASYPYAIRHTGLYGLWCMDYPPPGHTAPTQDPSFSELDGYNADGHLLFDSMIGYPATGEGGDVYHI
jgi:hypothetical protein